MTKKQAIACLTVAGFQVFNCWQLADGYIPERGYSWWLVKTDLGLIEIGPRKSVYHINWSDCGLVTEKVQDEGVTGELYFCHAYSLAKAGLYLSKVRANLLKQKETSL